MRKICFILIAASFLVCCSTMASFADWQLADGHKMHFPQLPDEDGWDVNATKPLVLADDFQCAETGWITDIHFWGSWRGGITGTIVSFTLSIHEDIPADPPLIPYSRPGPTLWEREIVAESPGVEIVYIPPKDPPVSEGWYDPTMPPPLYPDHNEYFQYNVFLDKEDRFWQEEGKIYWLNISAIVEDVIPPALQPVWGWKSSADHWNDDAVWGEWGLLDWTDMYEPFEPSQSLDLSFVITGQGEDFGDAPDPTYPTLQASNGASHVITAGYFLGACVDPEPNGQQDVNAMGDDTDGNDDEDGVVFTSVLVRGRTTSLTVTASATGFLDAWVDFNDDGDWADPGEQIFTNQPLVAGANALSFVVPKTAKPTKQTFARFRFSSTGSLAPGGLAADGEVEDYEVAIRSILSWLFLLLGD